MEQSDRFGRQFAGQNVYVAADGPRLFFDTAPDSGVAWRIEAPKGQRL